MDDPFAHLAQIERQAARVPIILPAVHFSFGTGADGTVVLCLQLPGTGIQFQMPFDRISFAHFLRNAQAVQRETSPVE